MSAALAAEVNNPDRHPSSSRDAIQWDILVLLFVALVPLPIFLLALLLIGLLCNGNNFGIVR